MRLLLLIALVAHCRAFAPAAGRGSFRRLAVRRSLVADGRCVASRIGCGTEAHGLWRSAALRAAKEDDVALEINVQWRSAIGSVVGAFAFAGGVWVYKSPEAAVEWVTGYLLEQSLSVDNLFVFLLIFDYFKVPPAQEKKVLKYGIIGAALFRGILIGLGKLAIDKFRGAFLVFAGILLVSSYKILFSDKEDEEEDLEGNAAIKLAQKWLPTTDYYDGDRFVTELKDGTKAFTPLLLVLVCIEASDVVFAVDSVPAIFGVTEDPFIVFTSNMFAIASLRSLYSVLSVAVAKLPYLMQSVGIILGFIGVKLIAEFVGYEISDAQSLAVVITTLGGGIAWSLLAPPEKEAEE